MIRTGNYTQSINFYDNKLNKTKSENIKDKDVKEASKDKPVIKSSESKLSQKAQEYLEKLRAEYGDYDFIVADKGDDHKGLLNQSTKEFSVMFSTAELERMASDEDYANEKMKKVNTAVEMSLRICKEYGYERNFGNDVTQGTYVNKIAISFKEDGSMSIYASLEKLSEKQMERIDKMKEKRAEESKSQDKKEKLSVKKTVIKADSEEDLINKLKEFDWNKISEEKKNEGTRIDFFA